MDSITLSNPQLITDEFDHRAAVRTLARVMDTAIVIPGTKFRVGLDLLIGLIPGIGDAIGALVGTYIVYTATRLGAPKVILARMLFNIGTDAVVGSVPLAGDFLDAAWRANAMNAALLEKAMQEPRKARRSSTLMLIGIGLAVFGLAAGGLFLTIYLASLAWHAAM